VSGETSLYPEPAHSRRPAGGWTGRDLVIGTSLIVLLVTLFMPWFSGTVMTTSNGASRTLGSADGLRAHGYVWFVFALVIIALIVLVARDAISRVPGNLPSPEQILMVATGLALLLTILAAFIKPSPSFDLISSTGAVPQFLPNLTFSVGFSYGGFVALVAAIVAFLATIGAGGRLSTARLGRPAMRRRPSASSPG
jgi:hypothetical protein